MNTLYNRAVRRVVLLVFGLSCATFLYVKANEPVNSSSAKAGVTPLLIALSRSETDKLTSTLPRSRLMATSELTRFHIDVERLTLARVNQPEFWSDRSSVGVVPPMLNVLSFYGSELSARSLVDHIGFQIDPKTVPAGESRSVIADYPVAATLPQIGSLVVRRNVLQKIYRTQSERELRLCVWVLSDTETTEIARYLVDVSRQDVTRRVATEEVEQATTNLKRAQTLLEKPDDLLAFDLSTP